MSKKADVSRDTLEQRQLKALGRTFRIARNDKGLLLLEVAEKSGISTLTISKLERGQLENLSLQTMNKIADAVGLKITLSAQ